MEESERLVYDQNELIFKALYDLYGLQNFSFSSFMHYFGMLKGNATVYSEITKARQEEAIGQDQLMTDRERMKAIAEAAAKKRENR